MIESRSGVSNSHDKKIVVIAPLLRSESADVLRTERFFLAFPWPEPRRPSGAFGLPVPFGWNRGTSWCLPLPIKSSRRMRFQRGAQHRPVVRIVVAQERLVQLAHLEARAEFARPPTCA